MVRSCFKQHILYKIGHLYIENKNIYIHIFYDILLYLIHFLCPLEINIVCMDRVLWIWSVIYLIIYNKV